MCEGIIPVFLFFLSRYAIPFFRLQLRKLSHCRGSHNSRHPPVEIIEEGKHEEGHLAPSLFLTELKRIIIHDTCWVIKQLLGVCGTVEVPAEMGKNTGWVIHNITSVPSCFLLLLGNAPITTIDNRFSLMPSAGCANCSGFERYQISWWSSAGVIVRTKGMLHNTCALRFICCTAKHGDFNI